MFIKSFSELQTFVASDKFLEFWIGELELPGVASCFGVAITVLWVNRGKGSNQAYLAHYNDSSPCPRDLIMVVNHLDHFSANKTLHVL